MKQRERLYMTRPGYAGPKPAHVAPQPVCLALPTSKDWGRDSEMTTQAPAHTMVAGHQIGRVSVFPEGLPRISMHAAPVFLALDDDEGQIRQPEAKGLESMGATLEDAGGAGAEQLEAGKPDAGASCSEKVDWQPDSPVPVNINADSAAEFLANANAALGNPHMNGAESHLMDTDAAGRVTAVNMKVTTSIVRPRWSGGRNVSDPEKALIGRIVDFIKAHEERHRDAYRKVMQDAVCAALGKTAAEAQKVISKANCTDTPAAHEALDGREGKLELVTNSSGAPVDFRAVGVTVSYREKDCK